MQPFLIAPSILAADLARLGDEVTAVLAAGSDMIHFDVMDNHFVPNLTFGAGMCKALRNYGITAPIDVHLMVNPVERLIDDFISSGANYISIHAESSIHLERNLQHIRASGVKAGISLNPSTHPSCLEYLLDAVDMILLMSVNPGFGGQQFINSSFNKIQTVRQMIDVSGKQIRLQVDGGITSANIKMVAAAGADTFVAGSAIFGTDDYKTVINLMRRELNSLNQ